MKVWGAKLPTAYHCVQAGEATHCTRRSCNHQLEVTRSRLGRFDGDLMNVGRYIALVLLFGAAGVLLWLARSAPTEAHVDELVVSREEAAKTEARWRRNLEERRRQSRLKRASASLPTQHRTRPELVSIREPRDKAKSRIVERMDQIMFGLFEQMNQVEEFLSRLSQSLPYLADDQLVEAFAYASSYGKRSWLIQAAVLYESQQRSIYGDQSLEAIARRFEISLRQAQKYALAWKTFFHQDRLQENVNIDVFLLDQPSWYVVAATESEHPHRWLAYAQDRKIGDPKYSISTFRQDIREARDANLIPLGNEEIPKSEVGLPRLGDPRCPWVKEFCIASGKPIPLSDCQACVFQKTRKCETKPILEEV